MVREWSLVATELYDLERELPSGRSIYNKVTPQHEQRALIENREECSGVWQHPSDRKKAERGWRR